MRRWLRLAVWLYPAAWRRRYGAEFEALLDDLRPSTRDLWDIARGALLMQVSTPVSYLKLGAITAVIGAVGAAAVTLAMPGRYVSRAVLRIAAPSDSGDASWRSRLAATRRTPRSTGIRCSATCRSGSGTVPRDRVVARERWWPVRRERSGTADPPAVPSR